MGSSIELFTNFKNGREVLVETGLYSGNGVRFGLAAGFEEVYSCDINPHWVATAKKEFCDNRVFTSCVESPLFLKVCLSHLQNRSVVLFLDGHAMPHDQFDESRGFGPETMGSKPCPLMDELYEIKMSGRKDLIVLIDDFQCFGTWAFEFLSAETVIKYMRAINPSYKVVKFQNILCFVI